MQLLDRSVGRACDSVDREGFIQDINGGVRF